MILTNSRQMNILECRISYDNDDRFVNRCFLICKLLQLVILVTKTLFLNRYNVATDNKIILGWDLFGKTFYNKMSVVSVRTLHVDGEITLSLSVGCTICLVMVLAIPVANIVIGEY